MHLEGAYSDYQTESPWPHFRGESNSNTGQASFYGPIAKPALTWEFHHNSSETYSTPAVASDGTVYVPLNSSLFALSSQGSLKWRFETKLTIFSSPAIGQHDEIYFGSDKFYCLSSFGTLQWSFLTNSSIYSSPSIATDGTVYFADYDGYLYALDPFITKSSSSSSSSSGIWSRSKWKYQVSAYEYCYFSSPAISSDGTIYVGCDDTFLHAISSLGSLIWKFKTGGEIQSTPAIGLDGTIYIGSMDSRMYAISPQGELIWTKKLGGPIYFSSPALSQDGSTLYIGSNSNVLYALSTVKKGSDIWTYAKDDYILSSAAIGADGIIYMGCSDNYLYALTRDGDLLWRYEESSHVISSPVLAANGLLYTVSNDGHIYALQGNYSSPSSIIINHTSHSSSSSSPYTNKFSTIFILFITCIIIVIVLIVLWISKLLNDTFNCCCWPKTCKHLFRFLQPRKNKHAVNRHDGHEPEFNTQNNALFIEMIELKKYAIVSHLQWKDIELCTSTTHHQSTGEEGARIGQGSFGEVFLANLLTHHHHQNKEANIRVVVKILKPTGHADYDKNIIQMALEECRIIKEAENKMFYKDCIVKLYGIVEGDVSEEMGNLMNVHNAIGIVMRYEGGGTLTDRIHPKHHHHHQYAAEVMEDLLGWGMLDTSSTPTAMTMSCQEKIRLITGIARGLAELHSIGIIHGDIKPDNILLSNDDPPQVRLADFGLARMRENSLNHSSLNETKHTRGTLLYCAPEMMINPFTDTNDTAADMERKVTKANHKTDMYAFAIVAWEVLSGLKPFHNIKYETTLALKVHMGERPLLAKIPTDCPSKIIDMIQLCWDRDRYMRESAIKCFSKLQYEYRQLMNEYDDDEVCLSYHDSNRDICERYYHRLTQLGCKVCILDNNNNSNNNQCNIGHIVHYTSSPSSSSSLNENKRIIERSKIIIAFVNQFYQTNQECMNHLRQAKEMTPCKAIITIITQSGYTDWADLDIYYLCQLRSEMQKFWDISHIMTTDVASATVARDSKTTTAMSHTTDDANDDDDTIDDGDDERLSLLNNNIDNYNSSNKTNTNTNHSSNNSNNRNNVNNSHDNKNRSNNSNGWFSSYINLNIFGQIDATTNSTNKNTDKTMMMMEMDLKSDIINHSKDDDDDDDDDSNSSSSNSTMNNQHLQSEYNKYIDDLHQLIMTTLTIQKDKYLENFNLLHQ